MNKVTQFKIRPIQIHLAMIGWQIQWIADREADAAWVGGYGARGEFDPLRERLLIRGDELLDRLQALGGTLPIQLR